MKNKITKEQVMEYFSNVPNYRLEDEVDELIDLNRLKIYTEVEKLEERIEELEEEVKEKQNEIEDLESDILELKQKEKVIIRQEY